MNTPLTVDTPLLKRVFGLAPTVAGLPARLICTDELPVDDERRRSALTVQGFRGEGGQTAFDPGISGSSTDGGELLVGLGERRQLHVDLVRDALGRIGRLAAGGAVISAVDLATASALDPTELVMAATDGFVLGLDAAQAVTDDDLAAPTPTVPHLVGSRLEADEVARVVAHARTVSWSTIIARALSNRAPNLKTPPLYAETLSRVLGLPVRILGTDDLTAGGYGGVRAVGAGSADGPLIVEACYEPERWSRHVVLVGKGVTFDAGGLMLKDSGWLPIMKTDMAGSAVVAAALATAAHERLPIKITGVFVLAENMPSGSAYRPGDVLTLADGHRVEVTNTDAEGRIILADGLVHASRLAGADVVIDVGTLSSSCVAALGTRFGAVSGNDETVVAVLLRAGTATGERLCEIPLPRATPAELLAANPAADLVNDAGQPGDAVAAAAFLREFVTVPWAHLDLIGPTWTQTAGATHPVGATGFGARLLLAALHEFSGSP